MAAPLHTRSLLRSSTVSVSDYDCRASKGGCGCEECSTDYEVVFVRHGVFLKHFGKKTVVGNPNHVIFFEPGQEYRVSHPGHEGDRCTIFRVPRALLSSMLDERAPRFADMHNCFETMPDGPCDADLHLRFLQLVNHLAHGTITDLGAEEAALMLVEEAVQGSLRARGLTYGGRRTLKRHHQESRYIEGVKTVLSTRFAEPLSLTEVARTVYASPFHLCRVFRASTGQSIHEYRSQLRLRTALDRLAEQDCDITGLALSLGYADHPHFTRAFRQTFGMTPSAFRASASTRLLREMSTILQA